jgi:predicted kinase
VFICVHLWFYYMSHPPTVVIVNGLPATGKTTLARYLAKELGVPSVHKDDIKETLFDNIGWSDRAWSRKLSIATYELIYYFAEAQLKARQSFIIEANFRSEIASSKFQDLMNRYPFIPVQILCLAEPKVVLERYRERWESGARHPGHVEVDAIKDLEAEILNGGVKPLDIGGTVIELDTTDFTKVDYAEILAKIIPSPLE